MLGDFRGKKKRNGPSPWKNAHVQRNVHTFSGVNWVPVPPGAYIWAHGFQLRKIRKTNSELNELWSF